MKFEELHHYLCTMAHLSKEDWRLISEELSVVKIKKGVNLKYCHDLSKEIMFLNKGIARSFVIDEAGREFTCSFNFNDPASSIKNLFVTDYVSVIKNEKSLLNFESLTDIEVIAIPVSAINKLYDENARWERIGRRIAEEVYCITQKRTLSLLTMTASQRYEELINTMPSVISHIPELHIASYLGITPQSLSRIKKSRILTK